MLQKSVHYIRQTIASDIRAGLPPCVFNLSIEQAAAIMGICDGHVRNQISEETFPIETVTEGSRRLVPLSAMIDYQVEKFLLQNPPKIGAPTKAERRLKKMLVTGCEK